MQKRNTTKKASQQVDMEITPPIPPLAEDQFKTSDALIIDIVNEFGEEVRAYIPQPHYLTIHPILPFLRMVYAISKNDKTIASNPEILMADWEDLKRDCITSTGDAIKDEKLLEVLDGKIQKFVKEALVNARFIAKEGEVKGQSGKLKDMITTSEVRKSFEIKLLFQYALIRYAFQMLQVNELRACYTALSFEEYRKSFLKYIEEMEAFLENSKKEEV